MNAARTAAKACYDAVVHVVVLAVVLVVVVLFMATIALPGIAVMYVSFTRVLDVPGGRPFYPTAFGGLFIGTYLLLASACAGSFSRRASAFVAGLIPTRLAAAPPGALVALTGRVVSGRPVSAEAGSKWLRDLSVERVEGLVAYPIVVQGEDGEPIRVEHWDGAAAPPDLQPGEWPGVLVRLGAPVFAMGELQRVEGSGGYRGAVAAWRLVRSARRPGHAPDFCLREGTQAELVREMQSDETPRWWGLASLALLATGIASVLLVPG